MTDYDGTDILPTLVSINADIALGKDIHVEILIENTESGVPILKDYEYTKICDYGSEI